MTFGQTLLLLARSCPVQMTGTKATTNYSAIPLNTSAVYIKLRRSCSFCPACMLMYADASFGIRKVSVGSHSFLINSMHKPLGEGSIERAFQSSVFSLFPSSIAVQGTDELLNRAFFFLSFLSVALHPNNGSLLLQLVL